MLNFDNGGRLCQSLEELPDLRNSKKLYLDFETSSNNTEEPAFNTWHSCFIAGVAITADDHPGAWYVPLGHNTGNNLPFMPVYQWLAEIVNSADTWINHNVKYDMHVYSNNLGIKVGCKAVKCTLAQAKLLDSDRFTFGLDHLSKAWLDRDISHHAVAMAPYLKKNKDYGWIPCDVMANYACDDVITNRELSNYIEANLPDECRYVDQLEQLITVCLYQIERSGMNINPLKVAQTQYRTLRRLMELDQELEELVGYTINPVSNGDCFDLLCNKHGLPILAWTDAATPNPSFDKHTLAAYLAYPGAPVEALTKMLEYRKLSTFNGIFLETFLRLHKDGVLHASYTQTVRTGRMSCALPNMQQLMPWAKELIEPREGHILVTADYSQIEYRTIVHYLKDPDAIAAYHENPDTDYHEWVAKLCSITRKPAKTVNFLMGYGGGRARLLQALASNEDLIASIKASSVEEFKYLATARAEEIYNTYHAKLPSLRIVTRQAEILCRDRGYVRNLYGRHRRLPADHARKAFNTINQSSAADLMKERLVALMKAGFEVIGVVHDEIIITMPIAAYTEKVRQDIARILEAPSIPIRVPIRVQIGASAENWLKASKSASSVFYDK